MTFSEVNQEQIYSDLATRGITVSDDLKQTIADWFNLREVVDDDNFPTFFKRKLSNDYFRYIQLLRIEPNVSEYDWLVSKYRERLHQSVKESNKAGNSTDAFEHGLGVTGTSTSTRTPNLTNTANHTETGTDNTSTTDTGTVDKDNTTTYNESTDTNAGTANVTTSVSKNLPASSRTNDDISTSTVLTPSARQFSIDAPAVANATGETQAISQGFAETDTSHTGTVGEDGTETRNLSGSSNRTLNLSNGGTDRLSGTDTTQTTSSVTNTGVDTREIDNAETLNEDITNTEIYTGRDESPQEMLAKAVSFIQSTCAWDWLRKELETCFMAIYEL